MVLFPQHDMIAKQTILLENILAITCKFQRILYGKYKFNFTENHQKKYQRNSTSI